MPAGIIQFVPYQRAGFPRADAYAVATGRSVLLAHGAAASRGQPVVLAAGAVVCGKGCEIYAGYIAAQQHLPTLDYIPGVGFHG